MCGKRDVMKRHNVFFALSVLLAGQGFAVDWYAKETRWAGHDPDIIRYEDGYALATTDNHMLMQFSEDALNWRNGEQAMPKANGLAYVPYDGYLARLHKGERVMTAREVQSRSYNSNLYVESMYMNNGTDAEGLAKAMAAAQRRTMSGFGS